MSPSVYTSVALSATPPPRDARAALRRAAALSAAALRRGVFLPLPLLLDIEALLLSHNSGLPTFRKTNAGLAYQESLKKQVERIAALLDCSTFDTPIDVSPLLPSTRELPSLSDRRNILKELDSLADGRDLDKAETAWRSTRSTADHDASFWFSQFPPDSHRAPHNQDAAHTTANAFWSLFLTAQPNAGPEATRREAWLDERFDHEAAHIFADAPRYDSNVSQRRRIWRLIHRRPREEPNPHSTSYEVQDPRYGAISLNTLASGRYGFFKIANSTDPRISAPPPIRPPRKVVAHLIWGHTHAALESSFLAPHFDAQPDSERHASGVSILQSVAALVFDDWRSAMRGVRVQFHAHCGDPEGSNFPSRPGPRWQPAPAPSLSFEATPPRFVRHFFSRSTWFNTSSRNVSWQSSASRQEWWCLLLLECDLARLFIVKSPRGLEVPADALPACISTLIVLQPEKNSGSIYRATHAPLQPRQERGPERDSSGVGAFPHGTSEPKKNDDAPGGDCGRKQKRRLLHFTPLFAPRPDNKSTPPLHNLRAQALDALIQAIEVRS